MPLTASDWAAISPTNAGSPGTLVSAATIAPVTFLTVLTGNTAVNTITPPVTHSHMLALQFAGTAGVGASGNILTATASVVGQVMLLVYNPNIAKYVPVG
jgi:TRAP-type C4-dicarboxylate transport system permease large subunit